MIVGSSPTRGSQFFLTVSGEFCCVALPFCCVVVVALPFSASLKVIVHTCMCTVLHACIHVHACTCFIDMVCFSSLY